MATKRMSNHSWRSSLTATLASLWNPSAPPRVAIVGIGQELRGDDAAGVIVARALQKMTRNLIPHGLPFPNREGEGARSLVIDAGAAPENCTGPLRRFKPDLVLLVDAAQMDAAPGAVRWLDAENITGFSASTHTLPLDILAHYLQTELGCQVVPLGIQPAATEFDAGLSPAIRAAVDEIVESLSEFL